MKDALPRIRRLIGSASCASLASVERASAGRANVAAGHRRSLALLADAASVRQTLGIYRDEVGIDVYLRLTSDGLTAMSLDVDR